jgi:magnesium-transporting ATPase (P-type)
MEEQNELGFTQVLNNWLRTFFKLLGEFKNLIKLESRLAKRSLGIILVLSIFLCFVLMSTWLCFLSLITVYLVNAQFSLFNSLLFVMLFNVMLITILCLIMLKLKDDLFFPVTRRQLRQVKFPEKEPNDDKPTQTN